MLRECRRVLKPGSRSAGYVIHTPRGLTEAGERRATELGPSDVAAPLAPDALTADLRAEEGDDLYEEERTAKTAMLAGIDEGVLCRSLIVTTRD